jgi:hypothetical protein
MATIYRYEAATVPPDRFDSLLGFDGIKPDMTPGDPCFIVSMKRGREDVWITLDAFSTEAEARQCVKRREQDRAIYQRCEELAPRIIDQLLQEFNEGLEDEEKLSRAEACRLLRAALDQVSDDEQIGGGKMNDLDLCPDCKKPSPAGRLCPRCDLRHEFYDLVGFGYITEDMARAEVIANCDENTLPAGLEFGEALAEARRIMHGEGATWSKDPDNPWSIIFTEECRRAHGWAGDGGPWGDAATASDDMTIAEEIEGERMKNREWLEERMKLWGVPHEKSNPN